MEITDFNIFWMAFANTDVQPCQTGKGKKKALIRTVILMFTFSAEN